MLIVNLAGLALMVIIVWWFWLYKAPQGEAAEGATTITVENGVYQPSRIRVQAGRTAELQFLRKDASPCAAIVQIPDAQISEELPLNELKTVRVPPLAKGEHVFHCQMQMYKGSLLVE